MSKTKILLNGYGRIGRVLHRIVLANASPNLDVVGINSRSDAASHAHLLKYDSTYGILGDEVSHGKDYIKVNKKKIKVHIDKDPGDINCKKEGIDVVVECTGKFKDRESCERHLKAGARKVIISAPGKGEDVSIVFGVNDSTYNFQKHHIISNASCTTNCLAPIVRVLHDSFGVLYGQMTTIHALTRSQNMLDGSHAKNLRVARAAIESVIPTTTGASQAIGKVIPELDGKINAVSLRVPFSTVSMIDLVVNLQKKASAEEINTVFSEAAANHYKNVLGITMKPLVSVDFRGEEKSAVIDGLFTNVINGHMAKVFAWYDNEWGYCCRLYDLINLVSDKLD